MKLTREQKSYRAARRRIRGGLVEPWCVECWTTMVRGCPFEVLAVPAIDKRNAEEIAAIRTNGRFSRYVADPCPRSFYERYR